MATSHPRPNMTTAIAELASTPSCRAVTVDLTINGRLYQLGVSPWTTVLDLFPLRLRKHHYL